MSVIGDRNGRGAEAGSKASDRDSGLTRLHWNKDDGGGGEQ